MSSKKDLKKKIKKLNARVSDLENVNIVLMWTLSNIVKLYDNNMMLISSTFEKIISKLNALEGIVNPLHDLDKEEEINDGKG